MNFGAFLVRSFLIFLLYLWCESFLEFDSVNNHVYAKSPMAQVGYVIWITLYLQTLSYICWWFVEEASELFHLSDFILPRVQMGLALSETSASFPWRPRCYGYHNTWEWILHIIFWVELIRITSKTNTGIWTFQKLGHFQFCFEKL